MVGAGFVEEGTGSEDAPIGPGAEEEAFLAAERAEAPAPRRTPVPAPVPATRDDGPPARLEDLVARIPGRTQSALHDLLRARFTRVRRLRDGELR